MATDAGPEVNRGRDRPPFVRRLDERFALMIRITYMNRIEERMPELSTRIVGGLGVLLLSPTVLTAASRCRLELAATPPSRPTSGSKRPNPTTGSKRSAATSRPKTSTSGPKRSTPASGSKTPASGPKRSTPASGPKPASPSRRALRTRLAVTASGLAAATSVIYSAPGTPWARADVFSAPTAVAEPGSTLGPMTHDETTYSGIDRSAGGTVLVDATPAKAGNNTLAVTVLDAKGVPASVDQWSATASLPGAGVPDVPVPLKGFGDGVAAADADLPVAGKWTLTVTVRIAGADPTSFTHVVPITAP